MSFRMKNARAPYKKIINKVLIDQLGWNIKAYVYDMLVKKKVLEQHLQEL
jgi:hypothetical protein